MSRFRRSRWAVARSGGAGLTACAGVALVKPGFPFNAAAHLAEELCKEAKKRATRGDGSHASCFAFHRVTTASVRGWDAIKEDELAEGRLVGGPWFVGDHPDRSFAALCGLVRHLADRDVPRGAIREWLTLAQGDRHAADKAWRRMMEVLEGAPLGPRVVQELRNTLRGLGADAQGWRQDGTTPVGDALAWLAVSSLAEVTGGRGGSK